jgi:predicted house-cleaning noncanonical NTP pyrophosphatase (MazG superfamily)
MKLVRDGVPALYEAGQLELREGDRGDYTFRRVRDQEELILLLRLKSAEEVGEVLSAPNRDALLSELGDLLTAAHALAALSGIGSGELARARLSKASRLGGYLDGWVLE